MLSAISIILGLVVLVECKNTSTCKETYTASSGIIEGASYKSDTACSYKINLPGELLRLQWTTFDIDGEMPRCIDDRVEVYIGCGFSSRLSATFCSTNLMSKPHDIYSNDGCIEIRLIYAVSTTQKGNHGFTASYRSGSGQKRDDSCPREKKYRSQGSGVISSPRWPANFLKSDFPTWSDDCEWDIEVSSHYLITLNFMDVNFPSGSSSSCYSSRSYVSWKGEKSVLKSKDHYKNKFCSDRFPFTVNTKYYDLEIELNEGTSSANTGRFIVGWVAYKDSSAVSATKWGSVVGGVIVVLFIVAVAAFCYFRYRRRNASRGSQVQYQNTPVAQANVTTTNPQLPLMGKGNYSQQNYGPPPTQPYPSQAGAQPYPPSQNPPQPYHTQPYASQPYPPPPQQSYPPPPQQSYPPPIQEPYAQGGVDYQAPPPYPGLPN